MITKQRDAELKAMAEMRYKASQPNPYFRELALKRIAGTITPEEDEILERFYATDGMQGGFIPLSLATKEEADCVKYHFVMIANNALAEALKAEGLAVEKSGKDKKGKQTVKRAIKVTKASNDFGVSRPTINKWEQGKGNAPENFTLADPKIYALCLTTYETTKRFNQHITESLKTGKTFKGKQMSKPRIITRGDIGQGRETDYSNRDPIED